ncbi:tripartite tricarboxylate transporter permease [Martelella endophytica]|uniref:DUF112 domain-containing protein n=1 Tax=Martelella endophytica TaxID=1486262 RepID=A0A0D5LVK3_MAREN|nr:tripartite tricarboxylate transporter permease [Martelella endophytica]AJY47802.1 hypothetical protein TM49_22375 [Martelella endophytica]
MTYATEKVSWQRFLPKRGEWLRCLGPALRGSLIVSFLFGNLFLLVLNIPLIGIWVRLLRIPHYFLYPAIVVLISIGVYSLDHSLFDVWTTLGFGVLGYVLRLYRYEPAPLLIGFILGPTMEEYLRRAMLLSRGDPMTFLKHPGSAIMITISVLLLVLTALPGLKRLAKSIG